MDYVDNVRTMSTSYNGRQNPVVYSGAVLAKMLVKFKHACKHNGQYRGHVHIWYNKLVTL